MMYDPINDRMISTEDQMMDHIMKLITKKEQIEFEKDEEACRLGELSDDEASKRLPNQANEDSDDESEEAEQDVNPAHRHIMDAFQGDVADDLGTLASGVTRASEQFGFVGACDRSSIQDTASIPSLQFGRQTTNDNIVPETNLIASLDLLRERELQLQQQQEEIDELKRYRELCLLHSLEDKKPAPAPPPNTNNESSAVQ